MDFTWNQLLVMQIKTPKLLNLSPEDEAICVSKETVSLVGFDTLAVPVYRASTIPFPDADAYATRFHRGDDAYTYGLYGTPTHRHLEKKLSRLERAERTLLTPSGQGAIALVMQSVLGAGDTVLIPDSVYPPVRDFAERDLKRMGIKVVFYDPADLEGLDVAAQGARLIWIESPGSTTMEIQDVPAIAAIAQDAGALTGCDNTWATPLLFKPLDHGVDIVVEALSKYLAGHSDVLLGSVSTRDAALGNSLKATAGRMGIGVSPDDCVLTLRGIETLAVRLARSSETALSLAAWLSTHPLVARVLHPALENCPGHALWARDFKGASGVFSLIPRPDAVPHVFGGLNHLQAFTIGASWGGTKSLIVPMKIKEHRTAVPWTGPDLVLRLQIGIEAEEDLRRDLETLWGHVSAQLTNTGNPVATQAQNMG